MSQNKDMTISKGVHSIESTKRINEELNIVMKNKHNFQNSKGIELIKENNSKYLNYLDELIWYENKKLKAISIYPKFRKMVKEIREKYNINENIFISNIIENGNINLNTDTITDIIKKVVVEADKKVQAEDNEKSESTRFTNDEAKKSIELLKSGFDLKVYSNIKEYFKQVFKVNIDEKFISSIKEKFIEKESNNYIDFFNEHLKEAVITKKKKLKGGKNQEVFENEIKLEFNNHVEKFKIEIKKSFVEYIVNNYLIMLNCNDVEDNYLKFNKYFNGWNDFVLLKDKFIVKINEFLGKHKEHLYDNSVAYIVIGYYILFNRMIDENSLKDILDDNFIFKNLDYEATVKNAENALLKLKDLNDFIEVVEDIRSEFCIRCDGSIKSTVDAYNRYFRYLYKYDLFNEEKISFYNDVHSIFECCNEFLNYKNQLDYLIIYNHIVYDQRLFKNFMFNGLKTAVINFYNGEDIININNLNKDSLYIDVPIFTTDNYLASMAQLIISKVIDHYKLSRNTWRQIPHTYYRNKFIFELVLKYNGKDSIREISDDNVLKIIEELDKEYPDGYKDLKYIKNKKVTDKETKDRGENYTKEMFIKDEVENVKEFIKESLKEYKRKSKIFNTGGGLR